VGRGSPQPGKVAPPAGREQVSATMRIALFIPCFIDALFPETGKATVSILRRLGHEVWYPEGQTCCGQIHFNTGYRSTARRLCRRWVRVLSEAEVVVAPSASCVAMVREHYSVLADEGTESEIRALASRTFELSEFLVQRLGVVDLGARFPFRVALHPTCHSTRGIDVGQAPVRLLQAVQDLDLVEIPGAGECCGFGGTFSVKNPDTSLAMMEDKIRGVRDSGAQVLTAVDNSCLMHIAGGLRRRGLLSAPSVQARGRLGSEHGTAPAGPAISGAGASPLVAGGPRLEGMRVLHLAEILATEEGKGP